MFKGCLVALVTPFRGGVIDEAALRGLVEHVIDGGVDGLVPCGTTGESPTLSHDEQVRVIRTVVDAARGRVPVVAGTGSNCTPRTIEASRAAIEAGADGVMLVSPYYNRPNQRGLYEHFAAVARAVAAPIMLYNIPGRTAVEISVETIARLHADHPSISAVKHATGSVDGAATLAAACDIAILSGDDPITLPLMAIGAVGVVSVLANLLPRETRALTAAALSRDWRTARSCHDRLYPLAHALLKLAHAAPTLVRRVRWLCAMAVSATIFWYFGWWAAGPDDPQGPVTLLMATNGVLTMAEMLGMAIVTSGLAVAICGAGSIHHGPMAVAVGLAALALRGGRMDALILDRILAAASSGTAADPFPSLELAAETWLWLALVAVGFVVGRWVDSWFEQPPERPTPAAGAPVDSSAEIRQGAGMLVVTVCVAYLLVRAIGGNAGEGILTGQVYFSVGAGFLGAVVLAQAIFRAASRGWALVAVGLVATAVYVFTGHVALAASSDVAVVGHPMLPPLTRPLPIEYAAVGVAGGLYGFELMRRFTVRPDQPAG